MNIAAVLTAFGLTQFAQFLPAAGPPANQQLIVSHLEPFGARLDIEIIKAPSPVAANRTTSANAYLSGSPTTYVHFIVNQRTLPLGASFAACGNRTDGWCELNTFLSIQNSSLATAMYNYSCNGFVNHRSLALLTMLILQQQLSRCSLRLSDEWSTASYFYLNGVPRLSGLALSAKLSDTEGNA